MSKIIAIDGGTTNTRFTAIENGKILAVQKLPLGIRNTLTEQGRSEFVSAISKTVADVRAGVGAGASAIVLSGMIGSETGLYCCPHVAAPISAPGLAERIERVSLPEICELPFYFIPGVKTCTAKESFSTDELSAADIMRGEETELVGIYNKLGLSGGVTFALPGSHMKYVRAGDGGGIEAFSTSIAGELIRAVAENTIISASLSGVFPKHPKRDMLIMGYRYTEGRGVTDAIFKVRILDKFAEHTKEELYSFLLGVILHEDIKALFTCDTPIYIGGSGLFRESIKLLIESELPEKSVFEVPEEISENAAAYGAYWLYNKVICNL